MKNDFRVECLLNLARTTGLSVDYLDFESRDLDAQEFDSWVERVSMRSKYRKSSVTP